MKNLKTMLVSAVVALSMTTSVFAGKPIKVGTGSEAGNYYEMTLDINDYCSESMDRSFDVKNTSGSVENLLGMTNKKFSVAWVQEDVLQYYAKQNPTKVNQNRLKIIAGGHEETVHLLLPKGYKPESNGWSKLKIWEKSPEGVDLNILKNQKIASWGGSLISAKAISLFMNLNLQVVEVPKDKRKQAGDYPILLVGGQPYEPVLQLMATGKYNMVPINANIISQKAPFYSANTINFEAGGELVSVPSVGVRALFIGKAYRKTSKNANMENLAQCISENLEDLADDGDTNPNWSSVVELEDGANQTNWSYFELK